jgi:hypothetical protein
MVVNSMDEARKSTQVSILAFSIAAAAAATIAGISAYMFVVRRLAGDPKEILGRCQQAIDQIERDLAPR